MHYTIAIMEDVIGGMKVTFDKVGNQYLVGLCNNITKEYTHKSFDNMHTAYKVFEKLSKAIIEGRYSYERRKSMLTEV